MTWVFGIQLHPSDETSKGLVSFPVDQHPMDALAVMSKAKSTALLIVDGEDSLGVLQAKDLALWIGGIWSFNLPGCSIWFQSDKTFDGDAMLALEAEGYRVVAHATDFHMDNQQFLTVIRLDLKDPSSAVNTLQRLGYTVMGYAPKGGSHDDAEDNLAHLMHFINL